MGTLKSGQPPYNGQTVHPLPIYCPDTLKKGQPLNNGQTVHPLNYELGPQIVSFTENFLYRVLYLEYPLSEVLLK